MTSDQLKFGRAAREGGKKISFFQANVQLGPDFKAIYDIYIQIEALHKTLNFYDMTEVFNIIQTQTITTL